MQLLRDSSKHLAQSIVTIGNFDGVHLGHQQLIRKMVNEAKARRMPSVLLTFSPHPTEFFKPTQPAARLMRFSEKWKVVQSFGVDYFYCATFNATLSQLSPEDFVKNILIKKLHAKKIIVGDDFRFGAKRVGDIALLTTLGKKHGFEVEAIPQLQYDHDRISSSRVRDAIFQGDFALAEKLTGGSFCLSGKVAYGNQIGRTLGFPTANIYLRRKQVPLMGIFAVKVYDLRQQPLPGVASIGYRPTFNGKQIILEVFLFDFDEVIYGKKITVEFLSKIRDEVKFDSVDALVLQIADDVRVAKERITD